MRIKPVLHQGMGRAGTVGKNQQGTRVTYMRMLRMLSQALVSVHSFTHYRAKIKYCATFSPVSRPPFFQLCEIR